VKLADGEEYGIKSFDLNQIFQCAKTLVADSAHEHQMFRLGKISEFSAVFDDFPRRLRADVWEFFKLGGGSRIDVDRRSRDLYLSFGWKNLFCIIFPVASKQKNARQQKQKFTCENANVEIIRVMSSHFLSIRFEKLMLLQDAKC